METLTRRGRPKNEELLAQRREEILAFATEMFSKSGFQRTDVQMIADGLGLGKGTIYRYFESKEELFLSCVDRAMAGLGAWVDAHVATIEEPIARIVAAIRAFLAFFDTYPEFVELLIQERAEFRDRELPTYVTHREKNICSWHEVLRRLMQEGRMRSMPAESITRVISNALYGKLFTSYFGREGRSYESQADELLMVVFAGILSDAELPNINLYISGTKP